MRIYMQIPATDGNPPRFCHLILQKELLEGWSLIREMGQQGKAGRVRRQYFASHEEALAALMKERDRQLRRGYQVVFFRGEAPE